MVFKMADSGGNINKKEAKMKVLLKGIKNMIFACLIVAATVYYLPGGYQSGATINEKIVYWDKFKSAFDAFLEYPSPENARMFLGTLPQDKIDSVTEDTSKIIYYIYSWENYGILKNEIWAGNRYAVEAAFRMLNIADGEFAGNLCTTLGTLIRINPRLFLEVLYEYKESWIFEFLDHIIPRVDVAYVDRFKAKAYERRMRIKALESVTDTKYQEIRKACVDLLLKAINEY